MHPSDLIQDVAVAFDDGLKFFLFGDHNVREIFGQLLRHDPRVVKHLTGRYPFERVDDQTGEQEVLAGVRSIFDGLDEPI